MKTKKILKVLKHIQKRCKTLDGECHECEFFKTVYGCMLFKDFPETWDIKTIKKNIEEKV